MKIAVCIKRVPDMESRFKIAADGTSVDEAGLKFAMSDFDESIRLDPNSADAFYSRGLVWGDRREFDKAIRDFGDSSAS